MARALRSVRLKQKVDLCWGEATWWVTGLCGEGGRGATVHRASEVHGAVASRSWLASLTGDREVRKAPGRAGAAAAIFFRAAFLRSFCRRRLSFPGLGSRGGGPGGLWGLGPPASRVTDAAEMSMASP